MLKNEIVPLSHYSEALCHPPPFTLLVLKTACYEDILHWIVNQSGAKFVCDDNVNRDDDADWNMQYSRVWEGGGSGCLFVSDRPRWHQLLCLVQLSGRLQRASSASNTLYFCISISIFESLFKFNIIFWAFDNWTTRGALQLTHRKRECWCISVEIHVYQ